MALKDAGIPARDYGNNRPRIAVKLYEGDLVYDNAIFNMDGKTDEAWKVTTPMHIGQLVELHEDSTARDIIVQPAEEESTTAVGRLVIRPKVKNSLGWSESELNRLPRESTEWGKFTPRTGTVEFLGHAIDYVDLPADNDAVEVGDYIAYGTDESATNTIALHNVEANTGGKLAVLSNYYGI